MRLFKIALIAFVALNDALFAGEGLIDKTARGLADGLYAKFITAQGTIIAELFADRVPMTVTNFVGLAEGTLGPKKGQPYYTGLNWYRVVPGFVIQSGNPNNPEPGDAGYTFPDEFSPGLRHNEAGILSMANGGPDTNSAEFFITLGNQTRLNYLHSVFGRVIRGGELLQQIKPSDPFSVKILRIGPVAQAFKADEATFKQRVAHARPYHGETEPGLEAHFADPDALLPTTPPRALTFNYKLNNFQAVTGIKIVARLFAKAPSTEEDKVAGAYMHSLAEKGGVAQHGVLAAYFAEDDDWRIWIGDESTSAFLGRPFTREDLIEEGALHKVKEAFLDATRAEADATFAAQPKTGILDTPALRAKQRLKIQTDVVIDSLILKLEPVSPKRSVDTR